MTLKVTVNMCALPMRAWADCYYTGDHGSPAGYARGGQVTAVGATTVANCNSWRIYGKYGWDTYAGGTWVRHVLAG